MRQAEGPTVTRHVLTLNARFHTRAINWPVKKFVCQIPELKGLTPAAEQSRLPGILRGVSRL